MSTILNRHEDSPSGGDQLRNLGNQGADGEEVESEIEREMECQAGYTLTAPADHHLVQVIMTFDPSDKTQSPTDRFLSCCSEQ